MVSGKLFKKYRKALVILSLTISIIFFAASITLNKEFFAAHFSVDQKIEEPNAVQIKQFQYIILSFALIFLINVLLMIFLKKTYWRVLKKETTKNILILGVTIIVFLLLFEAALRIIPQKEFGYNLHHIPNYEGYYNFKEEINTSTYYRINSFGLRDKEYNLTTDAYRILVLGDSFTFGVGVLEEETFPELIEEKLNNNTKKFEVLNAGVNGFGTFEEGYKLNELLKYKPDMIILAFYQNDYGDNYQKSKYYNGLLQNVFSYFRTYQFLVYKNYKKDIVFISTIPYLKETPAEHNDLWSITSRMIDEIKETAEQSNASFVIVYLPAVEEVDETARAKWVAKYETDEKEIDIDKSNKKIKEYTENKNIPLIDSLPVLRQKNVNNTFYYSIDKHWNQEGHSTAAQEIYEKLINNGLIRP